LLTNTNADGTVSTPGAGVSAILTGGNNGTGLPGTTDLTIVPAVLGMLHFDYSYTSLDGPGFDWAGYLLGQTSVELVDTDGQSGSATIAVNPGERFGFRVGTMDNTGEPGILTISSFSAPAAGAEVPEPATLSSVVIGLALTGAARLIRRRWRALRPRQEENR